MTREDYESYARAYDKAEANEKAAASPVGRAEPSDMLVHLAWRGALKACGVSGADRDAMSGVVAGMLATDGVKLSACIWTKDYDGPWETSCGNAFEIYESTPEANAMKFCCYCGGVLEESK